VETSLEDRRKNERKEEETFIHTKFETVIVLQERCIQGFSGET
jgi:hypothetical protein